MTARKLGKVYISNSKCIYQNLAIEEVIFRQHSLDNDGDTMLIWSNRPAVVIGRHQNPWIEVNLPFIKENSIDIARRYSGGGTVYHDEGNLNISLLTSQTAHCRPRNLKFLSEALNKQFNINIVPNKRDDMELQPGRRKISGTAARISKGRAYHHLTLLIQADIEVLKTSLKSPFKDQIHSNATASVRAPAVGYLGQDVSNIDKEMVMNTIIQAFVNKFEHCPITIVDVSSSFFSSLYSQSLRDLCQWEWIYGKTPKFTWKHNGIDYVIEHGLIRMDNSSIPFHL